MIFDPVYIHGMNCVSPLGADLLSNLISLVEGKTAVVWDEVGRIEDIHVAKMAEEEMADLLTPTADSTLLERMLFTAAKPIVEKHPPSSRTAFVLATTKGNVSYLGQGNTADAELTTLAKKMAKMLGFQTEPIIISQACVSGLLAVSTAKRLIQMGQYDDAVVLAGDVVSEFVVSGFQALKAMSDSFCKPFDERRDGVSLGEAAACVYLSKEPGAFRILGEAAINDANHLSGPSRTGEGLVKSIQGAAAEANMDLEKIDLIVPHGTGTVFNDEMEAVAFNRLGLQDTLVSALKGHFGHTLGASGLLELVMGLASMRANVVIPTRGFDRLGVSQPLNMARKLHPGKPLFYFLKTASGFGGSNTAMMIGYAEIAGKGPSEP